MTVVLRCEIVTCNMGRVISIQGGPKRKPVPVPNDKKLYQIVLKAVSEIRFIRCVKVYQAL